MTIRLSQWLLSVFCLALPSVPALAGKPGGGGTNPPPLPNVRYHVDFISSSPDGEWVNQINNAGMVVGHIFHRAFVFDQPSKTLIKLNEVGTLLSQLDSQFGSNYVYDSAVGINDNGQIVGRVQNLVTQENEGFALDTFLSLDPSLWVVRSLPAVVSNDSYAKRVNMNGQVLGFYRRADNSWDAFLCNPFDVANPPATPLGVSLIGGMDMNNFGQVAGVLSDGTLFFDSTPSTGLPTKTTLSSFVATGVGGINDLGVVSVTGRQRTVVRNKVTLGTLSAFRVSNQLELLVAQYGAGGINLANDVNVGPYLAYAGSSSVPAQLLKITDLIPDSDPMKSVIVNSNFGFEGMALNDRNTTGFSQIAGRFSNSTGIISIVLTPYVLTP